MVPPFVKLDSLTKVPLTECSDLQILHKGQKLDNTELKRIIKMIQ